MTKRYLFLFFILVLVIGLISVTPLLAGNRTACTNDIQAGQAEMVFNDSDFALTQIDFIPVCSGNPIVVASGAGDFGAIEYVTAKALGSNFGAVSLFLPDNYTGSLTVNWMIK